MVNSVPGSSSLPVLGPVLDLMKRLGGDGPAEEEEGEVKEGNEGTRQETLLRLYTLFFQVSCVGDGIDGLRTRIVVSFWENRSMIQYVWRILAQSRS